MLFLQVLICGCKSKLPVIGLTAAWDLTSAHKWLFPSSLNTWVLFAHWGVTASAVVFVVCVKTPPFLLPDNGTDLMDNHS